MAFSRFDLIDQYVVTIERDEAGWFVSDVVGLPGCHTQAKSVEELIERTKEAIAGYLKTVSVHANEEVWAS